MTGENKTYGLLQKKTTDLRIKQINDAGGINGQDIQIMWGDGQGQRQKAAETATKMIKDYRVNIIFGGSNSEETLGIADVTNKNKVLQIAPRGSSKEISETSNFTFRTEPSCQRATNIIINYLIQDEENIGIITQKNDETTYIKEELKQTLNNQIFEENFTMNKEELRNIIIDFQEKEIKTLFLNIYSQKAVDTSIDVLKELNFPEKILCNQFVLKNLINEETNDNPLSSLNYIIGVDFFINKKNPKLLRFIEDFKEYYKETPNFINYLAATIDAVDVLAEVLMLTKDIQDPSALQEAMSIVQYPGLSGTISFEKNGDVRNQGAYKLVKFDGQNFTPISQ